MAAGSKWPTLEDQRGDAPLLSSAWSLPGGEGAKEQPGPLRRAWGAVAAWALEMTAFARADRRKPVYAAKFGLALSLVSLLAFLREPRDVAAHSLWAIFTVLFIFEFSIGATLSKGFNRALGTIVAGGLALAAAELSKNLGQMEEVTLIITIFTVGFCANLAQQHPKMKPYEYGFRVFLLTFYIIMVSGYTTGMFIDTAVNRCILVAIGAVVTLVINIGIYPIWAGEDLHNLIAKNFAGVAKSLEGCVNGYLKCMEYERIPSKILTYQASDDPLY